MFCFCLCVADKNRRENPSLGFLSEARVVAVGPARSDCPPPPSGARSRRGWSGVWVLGRRSAGFSRAPPPPPPSLPYIQPNPGLGGVGRRATFRSPPPAAGSASTRGLARGSKGRASRRSAGGAAVVAGVGQCPAVQPDPPESVLEPCKKRGRGRSHPGRPRLAPAGTQLSSLLRRVEGGSMSLASPPLTGKLERPRSLSSPTMQSRKLCGLGACARACQATTTKNVDNS